MTSAPEGFNIIVHVVKIVVDLLHPVRSASLCVEHKLVPIVHIFHVLVFSRVESFPLLSDSISKTIAMIPNLQSTARHHQKRLNVVLQPGTLAAGQWVQSGPEATKFSLLILPHYVVARTFLAAVLVE